MSKLKEEERKVGHEPNPHTNTHSHTLTHKYLSVIQFFSPSAPLTRVKQHLTWIFNSRRRRQNNWESTPAFVRNLLFDIRFLQFRRILVGSCLTKRLRLDTGQTSEPCRSRRQHREADLTLKSKSLNKYYWTVLAWRCQSLCVWLI